MLINHLTILKGDILRNRIVKFGLNLFILHRLRNKLSAYINQTRYVLPGDLTSTRAVCVEKSQNQNPL